MASCGILNTGCDECEINCDIYYRMTIQKSKFDDCVEEVKYCKDCASDIRKFQIPEMKCEKLFVIQTTDKKFDFSKHVC